MTHDPNSPEKLIELSPDVQHDTLVNRGIPTHGRGVENYGPDHVSPHWFLLGKSDRARAEPAWCDPNSAISPQPCRQRRDFSCGHSSRRRLRQRMGAASAPLATCSKEQVRPESAASKVHCLQVINWLSRVRG